MLLYTIHVEDLNAEKKREQNGEEQEKKLIVHVLIVLNSGGTEKGISERNWSEHVSINA